MENQKNNSGLKAIVVVLALLLTGSLFYIYTLISNDKAITKELITVKSEKDSVLDSLAILKTTYDEAIEQKTVLTDDLIAEREKVVNLIADLQKSKGDANSMRIFKKQLIVLQSKMKNLVAENDILKKANQTLMVQRDSTIVVLG